MYLKTRVLTAKIIGSTKEASTAKMMGIYFSSVDSSVDCVVGEMISERQIKTAIITMPNMPMY